MTNTTKKWTDERVVELSAIVAGESPVSAATVEKAAAALEATTRSIAAKLRKMGMDVASTAKEKQSPFSADEETQLRDLVQSNPGVYTYKELAAAFANGKFSAKSVQGKILSMELTSSVKAAEKVEAVRTYTQVEEDKFVELVNKGAFVEEIASALGKTINSVRGKALSLLRNGEIEKIPSQKESHAKAQEAGVDSLGDITSMTVSQIAESLGKTERGIKTTLTRRGLICADYDGKAKAEKAAAKAEKAA